MVSVLQKKDEKKRRALLHSFWIQVITIGLGRKSWLGMERCRCDSFSFRLL